MEENTSDYPKYVSHKEVGAVQIAEVETMAGGGLRLHLKGDFDYVDIPANETRNKPDPAAGWYLIRYADGYISFSPAAQFEQGYAPKQAQTTQERELQPA